jgi:hypothetical protein
MIFLIFFYFCETFLPSWIWIRIPNLESVSGIRIRNPDPDSETGIRSRNPKPESKSGIRIRDPNPESETRIQNPNPESGSRSTDLIESGSETLLFLDGLPYLFSQKNYKKMSSKI